MYTQSLQSVHKPAYEAFFQTNELVFSIPYSFSFGNIAIKYSSDVLHARSSIPHRLYVGLTFSSKPGIEFGSVTERDIRLEHFLTTDFLDSSLATSAQLLLKYLSQKAVNRGIRISFFSEIGRGMCFVSTGHISLAIAMAIMFANSDKSYQNTLSETLDDDLLLQKLIDSAAEVGKLFKNNPTKGIFYQALRPSLLPRLFRGKTTEIIFEPSDTPSFWKYGLKYAVIFSWIQSNSLLVENILAWETEELEKFSEVNSLQLHKYLQALVALVQPNQSDASIESFFSATRKYSALVHAQLEETSFETDIRNFFDKSKYHSKNQLESLPLYHTRYGWSYLIFYTWPSIESAIAEVLGRLKLSYPNASVEYLSTENSNEVLLPRVEQSIEEEVISRFSAKWNYVVRESLTGTRNIVRYDETTFHTEDLLLDQISRRIYVRWIRISSKEIPTQQATIELLSAFFSWKSEVNMADLPKSSYTANKSDMTSKLITPIKKLTKKVFGEELDIVCRGGISDFFVVLRHPESFNLARLLRNK